MTSELTVMSEDNGRHVNIICWPVFSAAWSKQKLDFYPRYSDAVHLQCESKSQHMFSQYRDVTGNLRFDFFGI